MITKREAERLCKSFLQQTAPPKLPENYEFQIYHRCSYGAAGSFVPTRYNSSRAKCIKCHHCGDFFSPNKFIFHSHRERGGPFVEPDAANFNSWRRHIKLGMHRTRAFKPGMDKQRIVRKTLFKIISPLLICHFLSLEKQSRARPTRF